MERRLNRTAAVSLIGAVLLLVLSGCWSLPDRRANATRVYIEVVQTALSAYHLENQQYPFETDPPTQRLYTVEEVAAELVAKDKLTRKQASENSLDAWGNSMLYLLYDFKRPPHPRVVYVPHARLPRGDWSTRVNALIASGDFDWRSSHPVIGSAGADGVFGTDDDVFNVSSY